MTLNSGESVDESLLPGYEFFRRIGSPKTVVAPMVDQSDLAYRCLCRRYGAELVFTQMFNANCFVQGIDYREENFQTCAYDRPLIVQFCGNNANILLQAAKMVEDKCDAIDINLGCPQGIAKRGHYGAFLMEELELLANIVSVLSKGLKVPVTCKTRIYKDFDKSIRLCETLVQAGASMLTIHGRTRESKGHDVGPADWDMIRRIKEHFKNRVPIIANGGIENIHDFYRCLEVTGADAVMTSEAILENPSLFISYSLALPKLQSTADSIQSPCREISNSPSQSIDAIPESPYRPETDDHVPTASSPEHSSAPNSTPTSYASPPVVPTQLDLAMEYLEICQTYMPSHVRVMRSHVMKMLYRYLQNIPEARDAVAFARSHEDLVAACQLLRRQISSHETYAQHTWYSRHRNPTHAYSGRVDPAVIEEQRIRSALAKGHALDSWDSGGGGCDGEGSEGEGWCGGVFGGLQMFQE